MEAKKQTSKSDRDSQRLTENKLVVTGEEREGGGVEWGRELRGTNYMDKINKLQGYVIQHREYSQ